MQEMADSYFDFLRKGIKADYAVSNEVLGEGKFAIVKKATHRQTGEEVAVKIIFKQRIKKNKEQTLANEIAIMKRVHHPNCIAFHEMFDSEDRLFIVMELVTGGELFDRILAKDHYSETEAARCFVQMVSAIEYLHSIGIVHRDLKPENVLYADPSPDAPIKIADFGLGKLLDIHGHDQAHSMHTLCGTPSYVAPEVLTKQGYDKECDVWSLGVILYILLCGFPPFDQDAPIPVLFETIKSARFDFPDPYWREVSEEARDLIRRILVADPAKRLTPSECKAHPWARRFETGALPDTSLCGARAKLREWNAARRLKGAISTAVAFTRLLAPPDSPGAGPVSPGFSRAPSDMARCPSAGGGWGVEGDADRQAVLRKVHADPEIEEELRESFRMLDRDGTGKIDGHKLVEGLRAVGGCRTEAEAEELVARFGPDKEVGFEDFCVAMGGKYSRSSPRRIETGFDSDELMAAFACFDQQHTGHFDKRQLKDVLRRLNVTASDDEVEQMFAIGDANRDGRIDFADFESLMRTHFSVVKSSSMSLDGPAAP